MARPRLKRLRETLTLITQTDPNEYGNAYGLTSLIPILPGHEDELQAYLDALDNDASPLGRLPQLHMSRLHIIRGLVYQGPPQKPDSLKSSYLIFTTSHDGPLDVFLRDLARALGPEADAIWGHCRDYPGAADADAFAAWIAAHKRNNGYMITPWPFASVQDVQESLRLQAGFGELVERSRTIDDAELQTAFKSLMAGER